MLGHKLKVARVQAKLTQQQLAKKLGVHERRIMYWETDRAVPTEGEIIDAARILGADPAKLAPEMGVFKEPIKWFKE